MAPPFFPYAEVVVTLTGVAEVLGAAGILLPRTAPCAATGLAVLLVAMFPANVHAAQAGLTIGGTPVTPLVPRTALQVVFLAAVLAASFGGRRHVCTASGPDRAKEFFPGSLVRRT